MNQAYVHSSLLEPVFTQPTALPKNSDMASLFAVLARHETPTSGRWSMWWWPLQVLVPIKHGWSLFKPNLMGLRTTM